MMNDGVDRWRELANNYDAGSKVIGVIENINSSGAYVTIHPGMGAFLCVIDAKENLIKGRVVKAKVQSLDITNCRMVLKEIEEE